MSFSWASSPQVLSQTRVRFLRAFHLGNWPSLYSVVGGTTMRLHLEPLASTRQNLAQLKPTTLELGAAAILSMLVLGIAAQAAAALTIAPSAQRSGMPLSAAILDSDTDPTVASGAYLFGESPEPGQVGKEYMVFEVDDGRMLGGFYSPSSDFSCFTGNIQDDVMSLAVEDADLQSTSTISVQLYLSNEVAARSELLLPFESALGLQGTYRIPELDRTSQVVLDTCRAELGR